ncbi:MAG TPA: MgtC/SapB family protein [Vicinamibacterales bacterium]
MALTDAQIVIRLVLATGVGALLGLERERHHKSAGFRTNSLIALGSCVFTLVGLLAGGGDPTRIPGQVVTGIGFLGAGAILHNSERVQGMTTAAMIWVNAALGCACGAGQIRLAVLGTGVTLAILLILGPLERALEPKNGAGPTA